MIKITDRLVERFMGKVKFFTPDGCWEWAAAKNRKGYGQFSAKKLYIAHRLSYYFANGPYDENLHVLHTCDNPSCVNPQHLFLGDNSDNVRDKVKKKRQAHINKRYCPKGHPYFGENLYVKPQGYRVCRICQREHWRRRYYSRKEVLYDS